jgi:hypothetical protein
VFFPKSVILDYMIIEFLGCPRSGKTTTAARVFANLKEAGFNCEFIPEQARFYIASKRVAFGLKPTDQLTLDDIDQCNIMEKQFDAQNLMLQSCGKDALIVTDSSILNSMLYMSPRFREHGDVDNDKARAKRILEITDEYFKQPKMTFYSKPVEWVGGLDPNRVHTREQSEAIDNDIQNYLLPRWVPGCTTLMGDADIRWRLATSEVIRKIMAKDD